MLDPPGVENLMCPAYIACSEEPVLLTDYWFQAVLFVAADSPPPAHWLHVLQHSGAGLRHSHGYWHTIRLLRLPAHCEETAALAGLFGIKAGSIYD